MSEKNLGSLVNQTLEGIYILGHREEEIEGLHLDFGEDDLYIYKQRDTGKFVVLLNGEPIQGNN